MVESDERPGSSPQARRVAARAFGNRRKRFTANPPPETSIVLVIYTVYPGKGRSMQASVYRYDVTGRNLIPKWDEVIGPAILRDPGERGYPGNVAVLPEKERVKPGFISALSLVHALLPAA